MNKHFMWAIYDYEWETLALRTGTITDFNEDYKDRMEFIEQDIEEMREEGYFEEISEDDERERQRKYLPFFVEEEDLRNWLYDKYLFTEICKNGRKFKTTPYVYNRLKEMIIECIGYFIKEEVPLFLGEISISPYINCCACNYAEGEGYEFNEEYVYCTTDNELRGLVLHEFCHCFGGHGHTEEWQEKCRKHFWKYCKHKWYSASISHNGRQFDKKRRQNYDYRYGYSTSSRIERSMLFVDNIPGEFLNEKYWEEFNKWRKTLPENEQSTYGRLSTMQIQFNKYLEAKGGLWNE